MRKRLEKRRLADWQGVARAGGSAIPEPELESAVAVLEPLVRDCRKGFKDGLSLEAPVGSFRPSKE